MFNETVYGSMVMAGMAALFGGLLIKDFRSGRMEWTYFDLHFSGGRRTEPGKFWAATVLHAIPFSLGVLGAVTMLVWPYGIGS